MASVSVGFQRRTMRLLKDVPPNTHCPQCGHSFDIVVSRKQIAVGGIRKATFRYLRCKICDCRFTRFNPALWRSISVITVGFCVSLASSVLVLCSLI